MKPDVTSPRNERVKLLKRLVRDPGERRLHRTCVVEGIRVASEVLAGGITVRLALASPRLQTLPGGPELRALLEERVPPGDLLVATDEVLTAVSDTRAPQGLVLAVERPETGGLPSRGPLLVAWELQDPGNVGTLVRTAEAAGCAAFVIARGPGGAAADPYSPRAIRAAAASCFRLPVHEWTGEPAGLRAALAGSGIPLVACVARGGRAPEDAALGGEVAMLVGAETRGLPEDLCAGAELVTIPLAPSVESLNAAAAAAVVAFEAARQRRARG